MTIEQDLERDVAESRERIDRTIEAIQDKLTPGQLIDEGLRMVNSDASGIIGQLGQTIRANPLPVALVGVGLVWLLLASEATSSPRHGGQ